MSVVATSRFAWVACPGACAFSMWIVAHSGAATLAVGSDPGSNETANIGSGSLLYSDVSLGAMGAGTLIHTGGTITSGSLHAGFYGAGTYVMGGAGSITAELSCELESLGFYGGGTFVQNSGVNATGMLDMSVHGSTSLGYYALHSGTLSS